MRQWISLETKGARAQQCVDKGVVPDDAVVIGKRLSRAYSLPTSIRTVVACVATRPCDFLIGK